SRRGLFRSHDREYGCSLRRLSRTGNSAQDRVRRLPSRPCLGGRGESTSPVGSRYFAETFPLGEHPDPVALPVVYVPQSVITDCDAMDHLDEHAPAPARVSFIRGLPSPSAEELTCLSNTATCSPSDLSHHSHAGHSDNIGSATSASLGFSSVCF